MIGITYRYSHLNGDHIIDYCCYCNDWTKIVKFIDSLKNSNDSTNISKTITYLRWAPETQPNVWMINITTMPKVNEDWKPLTGWLFHDKQPAHPKHMSIAVPTNSAKKIDTFSTWFLPIVANFQSNLQKKESVLNNYTFPMSIIAFMTIDSDGYTILIDYTMRQNESHNFWSSWVRSNSILYGQSKETAKTCCFGFKAICTFGPQMLIFMILAIYLQVNSWRYFIAMICSEKFSSVTRDLFLYKETLYTELK